MSTVSRETSDAEQALSEAASAHFGAYPGMAEFVEILGHVGVLRGLIGPREVPRLWTRHVANCGVVAESRDLVPDGANVVDVGSGAGLPGIVWALVRPDLTIVLVEPLLRRSTFLSEVVADLGLAGRVRVERLRAEQCPPASADVVTARAVAPLLSLVPWTLPLVRKGGTMVALKGARAAEEIPPAVEVITALGGTAPVIHEVPGPGLERPTTVVVVHRTSVAGQV